MEAVAGALNGLTDSNGAPASIALAPDLHTARSVTVSDFLAAPAATRNAAGLDYNQVLIDRLRSNALADKVAVVSSQPDAQSPPLVTRLQLSAQWIPSAFDNWKLVKTYT